MDRLTFTSTFIPTVENKSVMEYYIHNKRGVKWLLVLSVSFQFIKGDPSVSIFHRLDIKLGYLWYQISNTSK